MKYDCFDKEHVKILWTGGWDSTFQVLQLLALQKKNVVPIYIISEKRSSTIIEISTMASIKEKLFEKLPYTKNLLQPTLYFGVSGIAENKDINEAFKRVRKKSFIGSQYEYLSRFCEEKNIYELQLCIHKDDKAHAIIENMVTKFDLENNNYHLDEDLFYTDEYKVFGRFTFPVFNLTKTEMLDISRSQKLDEIMAMTWFCHNPKKGMKPCGTCNPCLYTIEEGLGWRIPLSSRIRSRAKSYIKGLLGRH